MLKCSLFLLENPDGGLQTGKMACRLPASLGCRLAGTLGRGRVSGSWPTWPPTLHLHAAALRRPALPLVVVASNQAPVPLRLQRAEATRERRRTEGAAVTPSARRDGSDSAGVAVPGGFLMVVRVVFALLGACSFCLAG
jgi:hypothetical protein